MPARTEIEQNQIMAANNIDVTDKSLILAPSEMATKAALSLATWPELPGK